MFSKYIRSIKRTYKLYSLSQKLSKPFDNNQVLQHLKRYNKLEDELISFSLSDTIIVFQLIEHGYDEDWLRSLFKKLRLIVGVKYNNGFYIPASCLIDPCALYFLIKYFDGEKFSFKNYDDYNSSMYIADKLIKYFKKPDFKIFIDEQ